jgi:hypothetical protein
MNSQENLKITGKLNILLIGKNGCIKDRREVNNLVVAEGRTFIASRMAGTAKAVMSHMLVGSNTAAAAATDNLSTFSAAGLTGTVRKALSSTTPGATNIVYSASFTSGEGTGPITEAGITNVASGTSGDLLCRTKFDVINKGANDIMTITWTITLASV